VQGCRRWAAWTRTPPGLLLLTDDGKFIHRMSSPRHHVPKVYEVTTKHPLDDTQIANAC
jgi:16S rRNA pseudouridine516 synthase